MVHLHDGRFRGKVALVTGSSTGIGAAIAQQFAAEGASVALCGRREPLLRAKTQQLSDIGYDVLAVPGDVSADAVRIVQTTVQYFGHLDVLVNNAAVSVGLELEEMTTEAWRHVMAVNLDGAFELVASARSFLQATAGNILHISSIGAVAGNFDDLAYAASKAGLEGFSRKLALELAEFGVRSNVIRPGLIMTESFAEMPAGFVQTQLPLIPLARVGRTEDIARAAAFLCSEEASFITGAVLTIDGGESAK